MKKVLFVATVVKMHIISFHIPYLKWFKEKGYEVHVCAKNDYERKEDCNIPFCDKYFDLQFERSPYNIKNINLLKKLKSIVDSNNYDIIHCHTPMGGVLSRLASFKARKHGTKIVYTAHGFHFFKGAPIKNWLLYYPVERFLARYTDVLITINKEDYNRAKKFKAKKVIYVPGVGLDISKFRDVLVDKSQKRKEIGVPDDSFVLLSVGELNKNKNHEVIIKAVAKLDNPNIYYLICGEGSLDDYLKQIIIELNIEKQVKLLGFRKDVNEIYKAADVFVFPSYREGLPFSLMEAMASGLPVICSNIRGNTDLIEDGKGGYLVEPNDVWELSDLIMKTKSNKSAKNMGNLNLQNIENYSIENTIKIMGKVYKRV